MGSRAVVPFERDVKYGGTKLSLPPTHVHGFEQPQEGPASGGRSAITALTHAAKHPPGMGPQTGPLASRSHGPPQTALAGHMGRPLLQLSVFELQPRLNAKSRTTNRVAAVARIGRQQA
jgi:hypothetical protein